MAANVAAKEQVVEEIKDKFSRAKSIVLIDYRGLTVAEVTELRNRYRKEGVDFKVYKNTLINRAIEGMNYDGITPCLNGPTAVAFGYEDAVAAAKVTYDFIKEVNKMEIKIGIIDGAVTEKEAVQKIAALPSREVLLAKALGSLKAPISNFVYAINAIKEAKEKEQA